MTSENEKQTRADPASGTAHESAKARNAGLEPEWIAGLRQIYDSVVEEELPDNFKDLLAKLDEQR